MTDIDNDSPINWVLYPLRGAALGVLVVFALLATLALAAGLLGVWLLLILTIAISGYAFALLDAVAEGRRDAPEMTADVLSPWNERRSLWLMFVVGSGIGIFQAMTRITPPTFVEPIGFVLLAVLPAVIATLGLESATPARVLNPIAVARAAWGMGVFYVVCLLSLVLAGMLFAASGQSALMRPVSLFLQLYAWLMVFTVVGGTLYRRRHRLGTITVDSPEQRTERRLAAQRADLDRDLDEAYRLARAGRLDAAYREIRGTYAPGSDTGESGRLFEALSQWEDKRLALRIGREWISVLIAERRSGAAVDVTARCLEWDPTFRPRRAAEAIRLVNEARDRGQTAVADTLLVDFENIYPDDPAGAIAKNLRGS